MSLANDNFCFHYLRHPPPPPESVYIFQTPPFLLPFFFFLGGELPISHQPPLQQVFVNAPLQDYQITNPTPLTPAKIIFRVKNFLCLSHMLSWTLLPFNFFVISFIFGDFNNHTISYARSPLLSRHTTLVHPYPTPSHRVFVHMDEVVDRHSKYVWQMKAFLSYCFSANQNLKLQKYVWAKPPRNRPSTPDLSTYLLWAKAIPHENRLGDPQIPPQRSRKRDV